MDVVSGLEVAPDGAAFGLAEQVAHYAAARKRILSAKFTTKPSKPKPEIRHIMPTWAQPPGAEVEIGRALRRALVREMGTMPNGAILPANAIAHITATMIKQLICEKFSLRPIELISHRRVGLIVFPRQIAMYLAAELTPFSLPLIGRIFGGFDHTTVMHARAKIKEKMKRDPKIAEMVGGLRASLVEATT